MDKVMGWVVALVRVVFWMIVLGLVGCFVSGLLY